MPAHAGQQWPCGRAPRGCDPQPHVSAACYHGYERQAPPRQLHLPMELELEPEARGRKRGGADTEAPPGKRSRAEVQKENKSRVDIELRKMEEKGSDEYLELLLWQTHGGSMYHLVQCL